jgi:Phage integrase, N-terminal SAM-like domain
MRWVPAEVWATFERRLDEVRVPAAQRPYYRKWVRFYLDFCQKYGHPADSACSRGPFLAKLASKNQSEAQRSQASAAVALLLRSSPAAGTASPSPTAAPAPKPHQLPPGGHENASRSDAPTIPAVPPHTPRALGPAKRPPEQPRPSQTAAARHPDRPAAPAPNAALARTHSARPLAPGHGASWEQEYRDLEAAILLRNYSTRTLEAYRFWIAKFQAFVRSRPTADLGIQEVRGFLSELAVRHRVAASTQNQAFAGG